MISDVESASDHPASGDVDDSSVDVVIVNWNGGEGVLAAAESAIRFGGRAIIVDNGSVDGSAERLTERVPAARVIRLGRNIGFAAASNVGVAAGSGRFVFLLNPDAEIRQGTPADIVSAFAYDDAVVIVGSMIVSDDDDRRLPSTRRFPTAAALFLFQLKVRRWARWIKPLRGYLMVGFPGDRPAFVDQVMGASFIIRRSDWDRFGGLDESYFLWFEEVDLARRAALAGGGSLYWPSLVVRHTGGASFSKLSWRARQRIWNASMLTYARRHLGRRAEVSLWITVPISLAMCVLADASSAALRRLRSRHPAAKRRAPLG